jgi:hypothetical protein
LAEKIKKSQFKIGKLGGRMATMPKIWEAALAAYPQLSFDSINPTNCRLTPEFAPEPSERTTGLYDRRNDSVALDGRHGAK